MSEQRISPTKPSPWQRFAGNESWATPLLLFCTSLLVFLYGNSWGLPNGNDTWANDAIKPGAPLSILYRLLVGDPWNSGWFWFKYPLGHVLVLAMAYAPYMGWLVITGGLDSPTSVYPYGMADPQGTMAALAMICRSVSALMGAGSVVLIYSTVRTAFGRSAGIASALTTALCYPFLYYAHTANVEVPYIFWMLLAFMAATRLADGDYARRWWILLGVGAAMSVSTKELGAGFFVALPPVILIAALIRRSPAKEILRGGLAAAAATVVVMLVANAVFLNPLGFAHRVGFLTQTLPAEVALKYAPYYFPIALGAGRDMASELAQLELAGNRLLTSVGLPTALFAIAGVIIALRRRPWWAILALAAGTTFYLLGARAMLSLSIRYVLPAALLTCAFAGIAVGALIDSRRLRPFGIAVAAVFVLYIFAYGWDVNRMFVGDPRYAAEAWLEANTTDTQTIEVYQRPTYLPRPPEGVELLRIAFDKRSVKELHERAPDFVLLSSAGLSGVTVEYKKDWKSDDYADDEWIPSQRATDGTIMNYKRRANVELLEGLRDGSIGYAKAAEFSLEPWIERPLIQSLNPKITIYAREEATDATAAGAARGLSE
jgi:hypothetical protein